MTCAVALAQLHPQPVERDGAAARALSCGVRPGGPGLDARGAGATELAGGHEVQLLAGPNPARRSCRHDAGFGARDAPGHQQTGRRQRSRAALRRGGMADESQVEAVREAYHLRGWKRLATTSDTSKSGLHNGRTDLWLVVTG